jgi:hypothetical protein
LTAPWVRPLTIARWNTRKVITMGKAPTTALGWRHVVLLGAVLFALWPNSSPGALGWAHA